MKSSPIQRILHLMQKISQESRSTIDDLFIHGTVEARQYDLKRRRERKKKKLKHLIETVMRVL